MPVDVELDALLGLDRVDLVPQRLVLRGVAGSSALEVLSARVRRGTASDVPLVGPVAVDVVTKTGASRGRLPVLAPQAVGLRVNETCSILATNPQATLEEFAGFNRELTVRVDNREQVEVVLVDECLGLGVGGIVAQQDVGEVFDGLCAVSGIFLKTRKGEEVYIPW